MKLKNHTQTNQDTRLTTFHVAAQLGDLDCLKGKSFNKNIFYVFRGNLYNMTAPK